MEQIKINTRGLRWNGECRCFLFPAVFALVFTMSLFSEVNGEPLPPTMKSASAAPSSRQDAGIPEVTEKLLQRAVVSFGSPEQARVNTPSITIVNTPDLMPLVSKIYEHYLGIHPVPARLHYRFELEDLASEEVLWIGESTAADYHQVSGRRICFSTHRGPFLTQNPAPAKTSHSLSKAENDH